jgi:rsbT co-antagonist protein RsbR
MDVEVDARRDDELGELAASFNAMAAAVRDREQRNELLTREIAANLNREIEKNEQLELLWATVEVLSAPVLPVWNNVLVLPVIGSVDDRRVAVMMEKLLAEVVRVQSRFVIIDVTGMTAIDAPTADRLLKLVRAVRLLGARCVLTGLRSSMASALVENEVEFADLDTLGTLESGLRDCLRQLSAERGRKPQKPAGQRGCR